MVLSTFEHSLNQQSKGYSQVIEQPDVVLVWPSSWQPDWYGESSVNNPQDMAVWLNNAFATMRNMTQIDPNSFHQKSCRARHRLVFVQNGNSDFVFGGVQRPYIGLRDGKSPVAGTEDWFGWLLHELSHDFFHQQNFNTDSGDWGDGMCDFSRYHLLLSLGMPIAAANWLQQIQNASPDNKYMEPARLLIKFEKCNNYGGPRQVWQALKGTDFNVSIATPTW